MRPGPQILLIVYIPAQPAIRMPLAAAAAILSRIRIIAKIQHIAFQSHKNHGMTESRWATNGANRLHSRTASESHASRGGTPSDHKNLHMPPSGPKQINKSAEKTVLTESRTRWRRHDHTPLLRRLHLHPKPLYCSSSLLSRLEQDKYGRDTFWTRDSHAIEIMSQL
jgi:hypothetical protein